MNNTGNLNNNNNNNNGNGRSTSPNPDSPSQSSGAKRFHRPVSQSLEALAISEGILESPAASHILVQRLREHLRNRGNDGRGFTEFQRRLNILDSDGSHTIGFEEFKICLNSKYDKSC